MERAVTFAAGVAGFEARLLFGEPAFAFAGRGFVYGKLVFIVIPFSLAARCGVVGMEMVAAGGRAIVFALTTELPADLLCQFCW